MKHNFILNLCFYRQKHLPMPIISASDQVITIFKGKPATLVTALEGITIEKPTSENCYQVGQALAQTHLDATDFRRAKPNCRGFEWWKTTSCRFCCLCLKIKRNYFPLKLKNKPSLENQPFKNYLQQWFMETFLKIMSCSTKSYAKNTIDKQQSAEKYRSVD